MKRRRFEVRSRVPIRASENLLAGAQEVAVLQREAGAVPAPRAAEGGAPRQRPDVAGDHLDVHLAVAPRHGADVHVVEIVVGAQEPRRLLDQFRREHVPRPEQELPLDDPHPGGAVKVVGKAEEAVVLPRIAGIEDVPGDHADLADDAPRRDGRPGLHRPDRCGGLRGGLSREPEEQVGGWLRPARCREEGRAQERHRHRQPARVIGAVGAIGGWRAAGAAARDHAETP